jgi:hypothetical protein
MQYIKQPSDKNVKNYNSERLPTSTSNSSSKVDHNKFKHINKFLIKEKHEEVGREGMIVANLTPIKNENPLKLENKNINIVNNISLAGKGEKKTIDKLKDTLEPKTTQRNQSENNSTGSHRSGKVISKLIHFKEKEPSSSDKKYDINTNTYYSKDSTQAHGDVEKTLKKSIDPNENIHNINMVTFSGREEKITEDVNINHAIFNVENALKEEEYLLVQNLSRKTSNNWFNQLSKEGYLNVSERKIYDTRREDTFYNKIPKNNNKIVTLKKINSLSNLLLKSKKNNGSDGDGFKNYLTEGRINNNNNNNSHHHYLSTSPSKKFVHITMALLSSKGPTCENRPITRAMRNEKGGVVDFNAPSPGKIKITATSPDKMYNVVNLQQKKKLLKTISITGNKNISSSSIKNRMIAIKVIQKWWREIIFKCKYAINKIIKIQSLFRGYCFRTYNFPYQCSRIYLDEFTFKVTTPMKRKVRKEVINVLIDSYGDMYKDRMKLTSAIKLQRVVRIFLNLQKKNVRRFSGFFLKIKKN